MTKLPLLILALAGCGNDTSTTTSQTSTTTSSTTTSSTTTSSTTTSSTTTTATTGVKSLTVSLTDGPIVLNSFGRALFGSLMLDGDELIATYQISPNETTGPGSITNDKNLYYQRFDRAYTLLQGETLAIDVNSTAIFDWDGDLGDHKVLMLNNTIYMAVIVKNYDLAGFFGFDRNFNIVKGPSFIGSKVPNMEQHLDMGFGTDGNSLFAQFFNQNDSDDPADWGASVYQISEELEEMSHNIVTMEDGNFVTGTSIVPVPAGDMGFDSDGIQSFSTNRDYGNADRVGIHTFRLEPDLTLVEGSTQDIVSRELDTYFPVGTSYNTKHQLWMVGYTMENFEGEHGFKGATELGPSFIEVMDEEFNSLVTIQVNQGEAAFRIMTVTEGDDLYVIYDEMDKDAYVETSDVKIERYRLSWK